MIKETHIGGMGLPLKPFYSGGVLHEFPLEMWIYRLANAGVDCWRFLPADIWNDVKVRADVLCPFELDVDKWNLTKWNLEYFRVYRRIFELFNKYRITPILELTDNCQVNGPWRENSAWHVNVQGVETFYDKAADKYTRAWIEKCLVEFAGLDIVYGQCNEGTPAIRRVVAEVINPTLKAHGLVPFCYGACADPKAGASSTLDKLKGDAGPFFGVNPATSREYSLDIFRQSHGCRNAQDENFTYIFTAWGHVHPIAIGPSDDGVKDGDGDDFIIYKGEEQRRPSAAAWKAMATYALKEKNNDLLLWFEHVPKNPQDIETQAAIFSAISEAVHDVDKIWPANWKKWSAPVEPVDPPPTPPDEKKPPESGVKPPFSLQGEWNNNKRNIIGAAAILLLLIVLLSRGC